MAGRALDTVSANAVEGPLLWPIWLVRLDVINDPVYVHTGIGNVTFSGTGDAALDGITYNGIGNVGGISDIQEGSDGSQSVTLTLPGIQLGNDYLRQIIFNADLWQGQRGYVWCAIGNNLGQIVGKPFRVKTARMDQMPITIDPDEGTGTIAVTLESQASYSGSALFTRYSEQKEVDPTDTSQDYIPDLANKTPEIGNSASNASASTTPVSGTSSISSKALTTGLVSVSL